MPISLLNTSCLVNFTAPLEFLRTHLPVSLLPFQLLTNIQKGSLTNSDIYLELFVDDAADIKCLLLLYSTPGLCHTLADVKSHTRNVSVVCAEAHEDLLVNMLKYCVNWSQPLMFCAVDPQLILPQVEKLVSNSLKTTYYQLEIVKDAFENAKKTITLSVPGVNFKPLSVEDAEQIFDAWDYKMNDVYSVAQIRFSIEHLPTMGAYQDGKLLSWQILNYDGCLDMAFTMSDARRLGLSSIINVLLASEVFKIQERVFTFVAYDNETSLGLVQKVGFVPTFKSNWIHIQPAETDVAITSTYASLN